MTENFHIVGQPRRGNMLYVLQYMPDLRHLTPVYHLRNPLFDLLQVSAKKKQDIILGIKSLHLGKFFRFGEVWIVK